MKGVFKVNRSLEGSANDAYVGGEGFIKAHDELPPPYKTELALKIVSKDKQTQGQNPTSKEETNTSVDVTGDHEDDANDEQRQQWSNPIEFLLSCIALSVGLGNVWRFPITAYKNGGGAFLIPYLVVLIFIGRPLYFLELSLGQFSSYGCIKLWKAVPGIKGVGYAQVIATAAILTYYVSLMALTVFYFFMSFQSELPWSVCDPSWADMATCVPVTSNYSAASSVVNSTLGAMHHPSNLTKMQSSAEMYFKRYVTHEADSWESGMGIPDWKLAICLAVAWFILFLTLVKGVQSAGKAAYFTALFPYVVLFTLLIKGVTLPGAMDGILYFLTPQWHMLLDPNVWYQAVTQSFFSLSVAFGSISMFSSYNDFRHNVYRDAWIISFMDTGTSLLAGMTIFAILGNLKYEIQADSIDDVVKGGAGLAFVTYPTVIAKFDYVPQLFAVLFFLMLFTLGLGSATALTNCIITVLCDNSPSWNKPLVSAVVCILGFFMGLIYITPEGLYILELVDFFGGGTIVFILAVIEAFTISWIYGLNNIVRDFKFMLGVDLGLYWKVCWGFVVPVGLTAILAYSLSDFKLPVYNDHPLPKTAYAFGLGLLAVSILAVPACFLHSVWIADCPPGYSICQRMKFVLQPKDSWGPKRSRDRREWLKVVAEHSNE